MATPILRFKKFSGNIDWKETQIQNIATIKMGQSPDSNTCNDRGNGTPLIQGNADIFNGKISVKKYTLDPIKICASGDIILTVRAPVGDVVIARGEYCLGRGVCSITPKDKTNYLYYYLDAHKTRWKKLEQGSTFTAINSDDIKNYPVAIPSIEEQQKIAHFFSTLDEKIEINERKLEAIEKLKKGLMQKIFSQKIRFKQDNGENFCAWSYKTIGNIAKVIGGGTPSTSISSYWNGEIQWLTPSEINSKYVHSSQRTITSSALSNSSAKLLPKGTILLTTRATIGYCSINNFNGPVCTGRTQNPA